MKTNKILLTIIFLFLISCERKSKTDLLEYIPKNADVIISLNLERFLENLPNSSEFFSRLEREGVPRNFIKLLRDPKTSGIDFNTNIQMFMDANWLNNYDFPTSLGLVLKSNDVEKVKNIYEAVYTIAGSIGRRNSKLNEIVEENYTYFTVEHKGSDLFSFGYNDEVVLFFLHNEEVASRIRNHPSSILRAFESKLKNSNTENSYLGMPGIDVLNNNNFSAWVDVEAFDEMLQELEEEIPLGFNLSDYEGSFATLALASGIDILSLELDFYHNEKIQTKFNPKLLNKLGSNIIEKLPNGPIAAGGFSINLAEIMNEISSALTKDAAMSRQLFELENSLNITINEILETINGNFIGALYEVNPRTGTNEFVIGAEVNSPKIIEFYNKLAGRRLLAMNETVPLDAISSLLFQDEFVFIGTPNLIKNINSQIDDKKVVMSDKMKKLSNSSFYIFFDIGEFDEQIDEMLDSPYAKVYRDMELDSGEINMKYSNKKTSLGLTISTDNTQKDVLDNLLSMLTPYF